MAQAEVFEVIGHIKVVAGQSYKTTDIPTGMEVVVLVKGTLQYGKVLDEDGNQETYADETLKVARSIVRGVRYTVTKTGVTYPSPNVSGVWQEFTEIAFDSASTYLFHDDGIVAYGLKVTP